MNKYDGHTPGPWKARLESHCPDPFDETGYDSGPFLFYAVLPVGTERAVCILDTGLDWTDESKAEKYTRETANARLIADAPTLLAQRDEAVALLRRLTMSGSTAMVSVFLKDDIDAFLSRLDKETGDASD